MNTILVFVTGFFEISRSMFIPEGGTIYDMSPWAVMISGGFGGFQYWFTTYPTDVIKSSMMADELNTHKRRYRGVLDCARKLYRDEGGLKRFYAGFTPCLMRSVPANATLFVVLETTRKYFPL